MAVTARSATELSDRSRCDTRAEILYRTIRFIRRFEERLLQFFDEGLLNETTHACIGQEADSVGVIEHLRDADHVFSNHRCHGHYLACTGDARELLAEIMRPAGGRLRRDRRQPSSGRPRLQVQWRAGWHRPRRGDRHGLRLDDSDAISGVFIGDGTLGEGPCIGRSNIASLWDLPVLVVVEDNCWSQSTPSHINFAGSIRGRFEAFGIGDGGARFDRCRRDH